jgi:hypothetical protein
MKYIPVRCTRENGRRWRMVGTGE